MRVLSISSSPRAVAQNTRNTRANKRGPLLTSASPAPYLASRRQRLLQTCSTSSGSAAPYPSEPGKPENLPSDPDATVESSPEATDPAPQPSGFAGWWRAQQQKGSEGRAKLAALGLAAVLAYGERAAWTMPQTKEVFGAITALPKVGVTIGQAGT